LGILVIVTPHDLDENRGSMRFLSHSIFSQIHTPFFENTLFAYVVSTADSHSDVFVPAGIGQRSDSSKTFYYHRGERKCAVGL
jgi:hypothetical protein